MAVSEGKGKITEQELAKSLTDKLQPAAIKADYESNPNTNAFTDAEKSKLAGIEAGAQVNKIETIKRNGTTLTITSKSVDISVPTVINNLTTTDTANALSANQGKVLNDNLNSHTTNITHSFYGIASGTNTYAVTISNFSGLVDGANVRVKFTNANTGACTLNINSLGAKSIKKPDGSDLGSGDIVAGQIMNLTYNGSVFQLVSGGGGDLVQVDFNNYYSHDLGVNKIANPTALSTGRYYLAATTVGNYALFGGGSYSGNYVATVDAYNTNLIRSTPTALSQAREELAATTVGNYALFGGGIDSARNASTRVDAYNTDLVRSTPTVLSLGRYELSATTVGDYALFGGGTPGYSATVDAYNTSLVRSTPTALSAGRYYLAATTVNDYGLFGGGSYSATVDAYNSSLVRTTPTALSIARERLAATTVGNYALFGGGYYSGNYSYSNVVDAYDTNLIRSTPTTLYLTRDRLAATTVGNYALFGGGYVGNYSSVVDAYNTGLVRSTPTALSAGRSELAATTVGNYALFGGGVYSGVYATEVDAYTNDIIAYIPVTSGSKYKFTEATEQTASSSTTLVYNQTVTGYVKYKKGVI